MEVRKVAPKSEPSSIAELATELSLALKEHNRVKADEIFSEISFKSSEAEVFYTANAGSFSTAVKSFNLKPSNSLNKYSSHFIHSDLEAIEKDWAHVGDSLWLSKSLVNK
jgi:hypothetical protein